MIKNIACILLAIILAGCAAGEQLPTPIPSTSTPAPSVASMLAPTITPTPTPDPARFDGSWQTQPSMLNARAAHAVVGSEAFIYALAGTGEGGRPVLEVERFEGSQWTPETTLPGDGLNAPAAALLDERIYLIGGFNSTSNVPTNLVWAYDLRAKTWEPAASLPAPRGGHAAAVLDGKIHVVGGGNSRATIDDHSVYDPVTDTWNELAPLPRSEGSPALAAFDGKLYAIGGRSGSSDFGDVYIYDPATDAWTSGPSIEPRGTAGALAYCGTIYLFGGESQKQRKTLDSALRLDVETNAWVAVSPLPTARNFARAVLYNGDVYVVGGSPGAGASHASTGSAVVESFHANCGE